MAHIVFGIGHNEDVALEHRARPLLHLAAGPAAVLGKAAHLVHAGKHGRHPFCAILRRERADIGETFEEIHVDHRREHVHDRRFSHGVHPVPSRFLGHGRHMRLAPCRQQGIEIRRLADMQPADRPGFVHAGPEGIELGIGGRAFLRRPGRNDDRLAAAGECPVQFLDCPIQIFQMQHCRAIHPIFGGKSPVIKQITIVSFHQRVEPLNVEIGQQHNGLAGKNDRGCDVEFVHLDQAVLHIAHIRGWLHPQMVFVGTILARLEPLGERTRLGDRAIWAHVFFAVADWLATDVQGKASAFVQAPLDQVLLMVDGRHVTHPYVHIFVDVRITIDDGLIIGFHGGSPLRQFRSCRNYM